MIAHPGNAEQLRNWDGPDGAHWTRHADHFDRALAAFQEPLLHAAGIAAGDRVLDIGCGTGRTTRDAARLAAPGAVLGVDLSTPMLALARERAAAEGLDNVRFEQGDVQVHRFQRAGFDCALSRLGAMFFADPVAAFANVAAALRPGGRLALLTWQPLPGNEWFREVGAAFATGREMPRPAPDAPGPFALSDPERVRSILTRAGFSDVTLDGVDGTMCVGDGVDDAYDFVLGLGVRSLDEVDEATRARALEALRSTLAAHLGPGGVVYGASAWIVRARRG